MMGSVVYSQVDLYTQAGSVPVELIATEHILQSQEFHVGAEGHLPHAVRVEVELVLYDLGEVLRESIHFD